jgi:hypothetical protein
MIPYVGLHPSRSPSSESRITTTQKKWTDIYLTGTYSTGTKTDFILLPTSMKTNAESNVSMNKRILNVAQRPILMVAPCLASHLRCKNPIPTKIEIGKIQTAFGQDNDDTSRKGFLIHCHYQEGRR